MTEIQCKHCNDKGYTEGYKLDGCTIYSWQKPSKWACGYCVAGERWKFKWGK